jgi:hypothetical protein
MADRITALAALIVAALVALAVPVAQLRTNPLLATCCCPVPTDCHCPKEEAGGTPQSTLGPCHHWALELHAAAAPVVELAASSIAVPVGRTVIAPVWSPSAPHASPDPAPPSAPS